MGTRSLTYFYQNGKPFCGFYRQMDGYPSGHGVELGEILAPITLVNGYQLNMKAGKYANGPGCLAAQVIANLKTDIGSIYMITPDPENDSDGWQEYEYHIFIDGNDDNDRDHPYDMRIECRNPDTVIFSGPAKNFLTWAKNAKTDKNGDYIPVIISPSKGNIVKHAKPELKDALKTETVKVVFNKADGTRRTMRCTQNMELIPEDKHPVGGHKSLRKDPHLFKVFDLDKQDWRSFRDERLVNYEVL